MSFVHLHCHSGFSLLEGTATPQALTGMAKRLKMPALALTDRGNLYGAIPFYNQARKAGIKPILGMEVDLDDGSSLVLLARNFDGYRNLCHLATILRLNSDPEDFPPAGFDEDDEILPWDAGLWGVPVFGFTGRPPSKLPASSPRPHKEPRLPRDLLLSGRHARGLVALSGGRHGRVNSLLAQGKRAQAARAAGMLLSAFGEGNFFLELQVLDPHDAESLAAQAGMAADLGLPIVATNDVLYLNSEDAPTARALAAARVGARGRDDSGSWILDFGDQESDSSGSRPGGEAAGKVPGDGAGPKSRIQDPRLEDVGTERYFKDAEQMAELFAAYPQALANARFIAEQCDVELPLNRPKFPGIDLPAGETAFSRLWKLCFAGATRRYRPLTGQVIARLKHELEIIEHLGFSPYFLVVYDIVHFARSRDIPIMARGSAADSLVAYVLGITQVDPLANDLLFERFLNASRAEFELPDIDLDLCWRRRDEVLHYVYEHYGRDHVAIVGTHITFRLRSAWREMGKVLGISAERISRVAGRLPHLFSAADIWEEDAEQVPELQEVVGASWPATGDGSSVPAEDPSDTPADPKSTGPKFRDERERQAFELCQAIEGLPRHAGMHCAGVVIAPGPIADIVPLQRAARDPTMAITQYDKDAIESMGLVKMDLLGSRALTTLVDAMQTSGLAKGQGDLQKSFQQIPFDDEPTYKMMADGQTLGCFQLESPGMRGLLKWLRPHSLNDMANAVSLFRPGPLEGGFLEMFMRRHLRQEPVSYHHPSMEPILKDTYGVILYQEQFLKLANSLAGLDLGEAEKLRKELGKTHTAEERTRLGSWFVAGAIERNIDQIQAEKVWEIIAGYSGFGFCKAHACSYALTAYRSAYMKAHYPAHYMAALLNNQGGFYGPSVYVEDARRMGIELLPPSVNLSGALCEAPAGRRAIRIGLQFVKGLSERTISMIVAERRHNGPFRSLFDMMARVEMSPSELTALVKVGACDELVAGSEWRVTGEDTAATHEEELEEAVAASTNRRSESRNASLNSEERHPIQDPKPRIQNGPLNRRQMMWLLPSLLYTRTHRSPRDGQDPALDSGRSVPGPQPALSMQVLMGDLTHNNGGPRVLGRTSFQMQVPAMEDFTIAEKVRLEQEALGFPLSRNEMDLYGGALEALGVVPSNRLTQYAGREAKVAGVIVAGRRHLNKDSTWMLFLTLQDSEGLVEVVLFPDAYQENGDVLANHGHGPYIVKGQVQVSGKGRGIGIQPPADLRPAEVVTLKMHPVLIASEVRPLSGPAE